MMKRRFKKSMIALMVIVAMISVTACSRKKENVKNNNNAVNEGSNTGDNTPNDTKVEENVGNQETGGIIDKYNTLLKNETDREKVYGFIGENITNASEAEADQLVSGVIGYENTYEDVDYERLYAYKNYVSDEVEEFLELMYENHQKPYMNEKELGVTLDELLDRAEEFEEHIAEFPDGITTQHSYDMYVKLMDAAIVGGYDKEKKVANYYKGDADNRIDGRAVDEYMKFLADEEDDDDNNKKVSANTTDKTNTTKTNTNTNVNNTNNTNTTNSNTANANTTNTTNANTTNTKTGTNTNKNTNTNTNNNTNAKDNTTNNTTVNVGDNSEEQFDAPITRSIVQEYVDLLVKSKNEITTAVEDFYANLNTLIADKFGM